VDVEEVLDDDSLLALELLVADQAGPVLCHRLSVPVPSNMYISVLWIRIRIRMFLGLLDPDPDPVVQGTDLDLAPDLDTSIIKQK
jgi:hypothetical protein